MPGYWAPWPGKRTASWPGAGPVAKKVPSGVLQLGWPCSFFSMARAFLICPAGSVPLANTNAIRQGAWTSKLRRLSWAARRSCFQLPSAGNCLRAVSSAEGSAALKAASCTSSFQSICCFSLWYSSSTQWKLLPPKPRALIPARRGWTALAIHGRVSVLT